MVRTSVIIPAYNSSRTIGKAIESAISQEVESFEVIVVDDGSTDSTPEALGKYKGSIKVVRQQNAGAAAARNAGVAATDGEYLAFLDADDVWLPGRLERTLSALERHPDAVMAFGDYIPLDGSGKLLEPTRAGRAPSHEDLLKRVWPILPSATTVRRSAFEKAGGFCEEFKGCGGEDPYMWLLLSEYGVFDYIAEPLMIYRVASPVSAVEKYDRNRRTFVRLVDTRYGPLGANLIKESRRYFAGMLLVGAAEKLDSGDVPGALLLILRAHWYRPFLMFHLSFAAKIANARNLRRLAGLFLKAINQS